MNRRKRRPAARLPSFPSVTALSRGGRARGRPAPILKNAADIEAMRRSGRLVAQCFEALAAAIAPGVRLDELDRMVEQMISDAGAQPLYKGYRGSPPSHPPFPGVICASVNEEICHGLPDARELAKGDIVGIDIGLRYEGWCGDSCMTYSVGEVSDDAQRLLTTARECLERGIQAAQPGRQLHHVAAAIEEHAVRNGFSVVSEWGGHGIGRNLHEPPAVPHTTGQPGEQQPLVEGLVFTIEPMINAGASGCRLLDDGWTVVTVDGALSAQYEHTIAITAGGPLVLSA